MEANLSRISDRAVKAYLNSGEVDAIKWIIYMQGAADLSFSDIEKLTVPELCILVYCTQKRIDIMQQNSLGGLLSG